MENPAEPTTLTDAFEPWRVLQINKFHYAAGGAETYYFALSDLLRDHGHRVGHFSMTHPENEATEYAKYFVNYIDYEQPGLAAKVRNAAKIIYSFEARRKLARLLDDEPFDLAHLHNFHHQLSMSILPEFKRRGMAVVYTTHDLKPVCPNYRMLTHDGICHRCKGKAFYQALRHKCMKGSSLKSLVSVLEMYFHYFMGYYEMVDFFVTPSAFYRDTFIEWGLDPKRIVHVPNFVHVNRFEPRYEPGDYFLYIGRLSWEKGIPTLVEAMADLPESRLLVVGAGDGEEEVRRKVAALGLTHVELLGYKAGSELESLIRNCLAIVLPSEWYENGPMSVIEAYAYGKPVIGARIGGIPEMVEEGATGLLFESGDVEDLRRALRELLARRATVPEMGRRGRLRAEKEYDAPVHWERIRAVYERVLANRR